MIDDGWENRSILTHLLEPVGFEVIEAENGEVGLAKAVELKPDLIITDLAMPVMDGLTFLERLRKVPAFSNTSVLVSSASVSLASQYRSTEAGGSDFIPKPVQAEELFSALAKHLHLTWRYEELSDRVTADSSENETGLTPPC